MHVRYHKAVDKESKGEILGEFMVAQSQGRYSPLERVIGASGAYQLLYH